MTTKPMTGDKPRHTASDAHTTSTEYERSDGTRYILVTCKRTGKTRRIEVKR